MTTATASTALAAINTVLDAAGPACNWRYRFGSFDRFARQVREQHDGDTTYLDTVLEAAKETRGPLAIRLSRAAHLARHGADNELER